MTFKSEHSHPEINVKKIGQCLDLNNLLSLKRTVLLFCVTMETINAEDSNSPEVVAEREKARNINASLFDSKLFSDATIIVQDIKFPVHKLILSARYKYFEKMFSNWKESKDTDIVIQDMKPEVFNIILEFVYKGQLTNWVNKMELYALELIQATNMLEIDGLRTKCENFIIKAGKIDVDTACEFFILADKHRAPKLKKESLVFITNNFDKVQQTPGYILLMRHETNSAELCQLLSTPPPKRARLWD